jgi:hypothetical protein
MKRIQSRTEDCGRNPTFNVHLHEVEALQRNRRTGKYSGDFKFFSSRN